MQSLGSETGPARHTDILTAFTAGEPLPTIITRLNLSAEDLHAFLSSPGISDRLQALRALARFDQELRTIQAQNEAADFLRAFLKEESHAPQEKRRAATSLLRGPGPALARGPVNPDRQGGARPDIADWPPTDPTLDDDDDADLDEDDGTDAASNRAALRAPAPTPQPPLDAAPDALVAHQLALIRAVDKPTLTPLDIVQAIDSHRLAFPNRYYGNLANAFAHNLVDNPILTLAGARVTSHPAVIDHQAAPPTATIRVTIEHPDRPIAACIFHLVHESIFFNDPAAPHAWHTQAILRDDSG